MMTMNNDDLKVIEEISSVCKALSRVLESELAAIKNRDSEQLNSLVSQKTTLLNELQNQDAYLAELFSQSSQSDSVKSLQTSLNECRSLNTQNRTVAMLELKHTNKSIEHLRSLLKLDDLPLYAPSGQLTVNREKRNLGVI